VIPEGIEVHTHYGIEAVHFLGDDIAIDYLQKIKQTAELTLDAEDPIIQSNCADNMILIGSPSKLQIQKYLRYVCDNPDIEGSLRSQALNDPQKILQVIKEKKFALVTHRNLSDNTL
jgi:hypothetical protein